MIITVEEAIACYPELGRLFSLLVQPAPPWLFHLVRDSDNGETVGLMGVRMWPDGATDIIGILSQTQARAVRCDPLGRRMFLVEDTLLVTVNRVHEELVNPSHPLAPCRELARPVPPNQARHLSGSSR
jgi:hypothetical protein